MHWIIVMFAGTLSGKPWRFLLQDTLAYQLCRRLINVNASCRRYLLDAHAAIHGWPGTPANQLDGDDHDLHHAGRAGVDI